MQDSESILYNLEKNAKREDYVFTRLYRNLYNPDLYFHVFKGMQRENAALRERELDETVLKALIDSLRDESYQPVKIKPGGKIDESDLEKLSGCPRLYHRLVAEVVAELLQILFPLAPGVYACEESPHLPILAVLNGYRDVDYILSIDLSETLKCLDRERVEQLLRTRIKDERFLRLINKFLKAGHAEDFLFGKTYSGTPLTGRLAGVLSDIVYSSLDSALCQVLEGARYTRYKSAILIGISGRYKEAVRIHSKVKEIVETLFPGAVSTFREAHKKSFFLGYQVRVFEKRDKVLPAYIGDTYVELRIPHGKIERIILDKKMVVDIDSKRWKPIHRGSLLNLSDVEIVSVYDRELRSFYDYYALAENVSRKLGQLHYVMEYSALKTFANKYRTTLLKFKKSHMYGEDWGIEVKTERGSYIKRIYKGFKRRFTPDRDKNVDIIETNNRIWRDYRRKHAH